jgi:hypothetical protein
VVVVEVKALSVIIRGGEHAQTLSSTVSLEGRNEDHTSVTSIHALDTLASTGRHSRMISEGAGGVVIGRGISGT